MRRCSRTPASSSPASPRRPIRSPPGRCSRRCRRASPTPTASRRSPRLRAKIPQLREALANRFQIEHHGILVAQLLAHIDTLDAAIKTLDERVEAMLAPHEQVVELLCTIPGVAPRTAQVLIAECGLDMSRFPDARAPGLLGPHLPRPQRVGRAQTLGPYPAGPQVADRGADRGREGRRAHQGHLPRRPPLAAARTPRRAEGHRRHPPRHPRHLLRGC
jgi:hypothetical protein